MQKHNAESLVSAYLALIAAQEDFVGKQTTFANQMSTVYVSGMPYATFVTERDAWKAAYKVAKNATDNATDVAFHAALDRMNNHLEATGQDKFVAPKSDGVDAIKKAEQREKAKKKRADALKACGITADMSSAQVAQALAKAKKASPEARLVALEFQQAKEREESRAVLKAEKDEGKALADAIGSYWKSAPLAMARAEAKRLNVAKPSTK